MTIGAWLDECPSIFLTVNYFYRLNVFYSSLYPHAPALPPEKARLSLPFRDEIPTHIAW